MSQPAVRQASHAGSWYPGNGPELEQLLGTWLNSVPGEDPVLGGLPADGARIIIAPHAGYAYSGSCAAYAYKALDLTRVKRVFLLGPSHHLGGRNCMIPPSNVTSYATPLSNSVDKGLLHLDLEVLAEIRRSRLFSEISLEDDEEEHSLEMHLPYIHYMLQKKFGDYAEIERPRLVPITVGRTNPMTERQVGVFLARYLHDPCNAFVISSDFCHWGRRFGYTFYTPAAESPAPSLPLSTLSLPQPGDQHQHDAQVGDALYELVGQAISQLSRQSLPNTPPEPYLHESITACDKLCMSAISTGFSQTFREVVESTGNTVCGRHPINIIMEALEEYHRGGGKGRFHFLRYQRSSDVYSPSDSSVSYVSAVAIL